MTSVRICTVTYRRPEGLARLLRAVDAMTVPNGVEVVHVVVDNDPDASARAVVDAVATETSTPLIYDVEAVRGIPAVRNRALDIALEDDPDWIAWMDDDETPEPGWLASALATQEATGADVVMGPNEPVFEAGGVDWVTESGLLHNERFTTGESYPFFHTRTSGVLLRPSAIPAERFDLRLALTGGEDRVFFTRIHRAGARFVYDNGAVMAEYVPASRARPGWLLRRWFRVGVTRSLALVYLDEPGPLRRLRRVFGGFVMALLALGRTIVAVPRGRVEILRASRGVAIGVGSSVGALGVHYREYRKIHGR